MAVRHLVSTGRTLIACILGPRREEAARIKTAAAREVLAEHGLRLAAEPLHGLWTEHWGRQAATQLVHAGIAFDGLMCGNDTIARGAVSALAALGVSVPDDVGVVGFDNWTVMAEADEPQLTSVDLKLQEA
ncbi:substrate-binding domain-containing protein [Glycomyces luteolus]|uniref:Substrate-binding domain-containing protein n=1 Tax=Glycomyces luteolus TaxID=2670330 RepID=A0A9X3SSE4_9ACTN|nr:substrate-binding domain-containing protein [Glycomyces luteolus]MDA1362471.1 substrate-binding domain-containing protein [Glycomyces luteolus]